MALVSLGDVELARNRIAGKIRRTPLVPSRNLSAMLGYDVWFKLEPMQKTGSFKVRGAINKVATLTPDERRRGVVTMSAGNHAQSLAWAAANSDVRCTVVMPSTAVRSKVEATRAYGGEVVQTADSLLDTVHQLQADRGLALVHPFDDPMVIAGAGTVADEIFDDLEDADAVVFGVGGGGLGSGTAVVARARRDGVRLIGVEPEGANAMQQSLARGEPVTLDAPPRTLADGLAAPFAGVHTFAHFRDLGVEVYALPDAQIIDAMWLMMERAKVVTEPAAAAALAGLLARAPRPAIPAGARVVCIVSGGNVDRERLRVLG